jgi:hypothetical protein
MLKNCTVCISVSLKQLVVTRQIVTNLTQIYTQLISLDFQSRWLTMGWTVWGLNPGGGEISHIHPDQHLGLTNLLYNGYQVCLPKEKMLGHRGDHPPTSSAKVKETVKLYICSFSGPSKPVLGWYTKYWIIILSGSNCSLLMVYTNPIRQILPAVLIREVSRLCLTSTVTQSFLVEQQVFVIPRLNTDQITSVINSVSMHQFHTRIQLPNSWREFEQKVTF